MTGVVNGLRWRFQHRGSWFVDLSSGGGVVHERVPVAWWSDLRGGSITIHFQKAADRDAHLERAEFVVAVAEKGETRDGKVKVKEMRTVFTVEPIGAVGEKSLEAKRRATVFG